MIGAHHFPLDSTVSKFCSDARCIDFDITGFMAEMYLMNEVFNWLPIVNEVFFFLFFFSRHL